MHYLNANAWNKSDLFSIIKKKKNAFWDNTLTILVLRLLSRNYDRIINKDFTGFTETKINPPDSTWKINEVYKFILRM